MPYAHLTVLELGFSIDALMDKVKKEAEPPTVEQMEVLQQVASRVLREFELVFHGLEQREADPEGAAKIPLYTQGNEPLRALIHGGPGTGKLPTKFPDPW